ncbi:hypothetical protein VM1G_05769 [Cytospora mali]|uniref:HNH nuclease domain-containing protein n=1 Tax=Cytospora mali TaxID=578113 RepID=A0A194W1H8_CYTMA|nr:hypothetical protein VM1G_05769 [Valsa mali]
MFTYVHSGLHQHSSLGWTMRLLRPPALPPPETAPPHSLPRLGPDGRQPVIRIKHPDYPPPTDVLITIPAFDPMPSTSELVARAGRAADAGYYGDGQGEAQHQLSDAGQEGRFPETELEVPVGLHHGTILTICGIIADNAFDRAFLSYDREGRRKIQDNWHYDSILPPGEYWLQVPPLQTDGITITHAGGAGAPAEETKKPYPIIPCFAEWRFPHGKLPRSWSKSHQPPPAPQDRPHSRAMAARLGALQTVACSCMVSGHRAGTESSHIVHSKLGAWFTENEMSQYNTPSPLQTAQIDQPSNKVRIRADLQALWESAYLTIVPKPVFVEAPAFQPPTSQIPPSPQPASMSRSSEPTTAAPAPASSTAYALAVHVLATPTSQLEIIPLYHNLALRFQEPGNEFSRQYLDSREFFFARFAWSIFPLLQSFLNKQRWIAVRRKQGQYSDVPTGIPPEVPEYEYKWSMPQPSSWNSSRKRSWSQISPARDDAAWDDDDGHMEEPQSRKRKRRSFPFKGSNRDFHEEPEWLGHTTHRRRKAQIYVAEVDDDADMLRGRSQRAQPYMAQVDDYELQRDTPDDSPSWGMDGSGGGEEDELPRGRRRYRRTVRSISLRREPAPGLSFLSPPVPNRSSGLSMHTDEEAVEGSSSLVLPSDGVVTKIGPESVAEAEAALHDDSI